MVNKTLPFDRSRRVAKQIRKDLTDAIRQILPYEYVQMLSITSVHLSKDFAFAKVYVTHIGDLAMREQVLDLLQKSSPALRHCLAKSTDLRKTPNLRFLYDQSVEYGAKMDALLSKLVRKD